jgi:hypothetical protein
LLKKYCHNKTYETSILKALSPKGMINSEQHVSVKNKLSDEVSVAFNFELVKK